MSVIVLTKNILPAPVNKKEILRYAGVKLADENILSVIEECLFEIENKLTYKVCFCEMDTKITDDLCDFGILKLNSKNLADNLKNCKKTMLFAATIGIEIDRLITKYSYISPTKSLIFQAIGAERIEALCDSFIEEYKIEKNLTHNPRFSAGYGDLKLETQKDIFNILNCSKNIGLFLSDSLLMTPTKSVTAFVGIEN